MRDIRQTLLLALQSDGGPTSDFDLNPSLNNLKTNELRPAAVLVAFQDIGGKDRIILTKRSSRLKHHPGQIAFPGGRQDPGDPGPVGAALREAEEEIGLSRENVEILGTLPAHDTVTGFRVTPVLGLIRQPFDARPELGEVDEIFQVPARHVLDPANYLIQARWWRGTERRYFTVPYGPYYIWGATARMLRALAERVDP